MTEALVAPIVQAERRNVAGLIRSVARNNLTIPEREALVPAITEIFSANGHHRDDAVLARIALAKNFPVFLPSNRLALEYARGLLPGAERFQPELDLHVVEHDKRVVNLAKTREVGLSYAYRYLTYSGYDNLAGDIGKQLDSAKALGITYLSPKQDQLLMGLIDFAESGREKEFYELGRCLVASLQILKSAPYNQDELYFLDQYNGLVKAGRNSQAISAGRNYEAFRSHEINIDLQLDNSIHDSRIRALRNVRMLYQSRGNMPERLNASAFLYNSESGGDRANFFTPGQDMLLRDLDSLITLGQVAEAQIHWQTFTRSFSVKERQRTGLQASTFAVYNFYVQRKDDEKALQAMRTINSYHLGLTPKQVSIPSDAAQAS
jgi:hypothetical protein